MAKQTYFNPLTNEKITFQVASSLISLHSSVEKEWIKAKGEFYKLIVANGKAITTPYDGFHLDVDTRRVNLEEEIVIDLTRLSSPFINVGVLFALSEDYRPFSIGPHMNDNQELWFSAQLADLLMRNQSLKSVEITRGVPLSICNDEPHLFRLSPDYFLVTENQWRNAIDTIRNYEKKGKNIWPVSISIGPLPLPSIDCTLTSETDWTMRLGQAWFAVEHLISKFSPDASIGGRFSKLVNLCL